MDWITKREAKELFPKAFVGVGGCDPIVLEPGGKYGVRNGRLHLLLWGNMWRWNGRDRCWVEVEDQ